MKVAAIIQARMGSTRLPGKVLKKVLGKTLLEYQVERVLRAHTIDEIIIATTTKKEDDQIVDMCKQLSINYYRGSEHDVLSRYYEAAKKFEVDIIVRLTSDCPLIDPEIIDKTVQVFLQGKFDYVSNSIIRTYPRGMDTEVFSFQGVSEINKNAVKNYEREHVTPYWYERPENYRIKVVSHYTDLSKYRLTVDTIEDFKLISNIISSVYIKNRHYTLEDIIKVISDNPDWLLINSHINQKTF
ncbi:hypothetical protein J27TS8_40580 [Robertmurraya siralis]|uniref:Acylneuraminate cytidylyltransferase n=1 Tax=Robertmurraya siralis TaxID=77777 RepID=A0A919WL18_9BACI|nr:glycosyltransferase family protein [Robertmurraya siralis]GIN64065.1 hypothetical protein J27TS8_40580 [Robertmurraya siralis]